VDGLLIGIAVGVLSGVVVGVVAGLTVMACKHPKSYEKLYGALLIILLGALAGGTFWDLRNGVGYSICRYRCHYLFFVLAGSSSLFGQGQAGKGRG
jgi:hypothetical protein